MSSRSTANSDPILTNFAVGLAPDLRSSLARFASPLCPVGATIGHYKRYNKKNRFATYETARALGGPARRIEFSADDPTYNCKPQALEAAIDDAERDAAGDADPILLEQAKTQTLVSNAALGHAVKVFAKFTGTLTAVSGKGGWSNPDIDPVAELDEQIEAITLATGQMPNRMIIDITAFRTFRDNAKVKARFPGIESIAIDRMKAASLLLNPSIEIQIGTLSYDTTKPGKTQSNASITANDVFLFFASQSPTVYDGSFCKTFIGGRGGIESVRRYRDDSCRSDIIALDWSEDIQITSEESGRRITVS